MSDFARLFLLLAMAGAVVTALGGVAIWMMDEARRLRRALRRVLGAPPDAVVVARGRGRGAGLSLREGRVTVAWDGGSWCLVYRLDELQGAELLIDGQVTARVFRGEPRRALDVISRDADRVTLRLVFDDAKEPDFELDLWMAGDEQRRDAISPAQAAQEANRWIARVEAILRRPQAPRAQPDFAHPPQPAPTLAAPAVAAAGITDEQVFDQVEADSPPWDEPSDEDRDR